MDIIIRPEIENDYKEVETLTREAFWDLYRPGCVEHLLAHKLRKVTAFIPELDFVAVLNKQVVGNIMYSKASVARDNGRKHQVITFGPISVMPSYQKQGIGYALIERTKKLAEKMGFKAVFIYGDPAYYHRFGFINAGDFGITTADGDNFEEFMALELYKGALKGITGKYYDDPVFQIDEAELEMFEKRFPFKEKHVTDTQLK